MKRALPFVLIALAITVFIFVIDPQYEKVQALSQDKEDNDTMLGLAQDLQRKRDLLHDAFNAISPEERLELEKLLPDTVDNVRLILAINNIAEQYGIIIRNISISREGQGEEGQRNVVSSVDASGDIGTITLSFSMDATYDIFISFMQDLERALRIVDIRGLQINRNTEDGVFMNYSVTLDTYWLR